MDSDIRDTTKAIFAVRNIERTSTRNARKLRQKKGYVEKENYLVELSDLCKFIESKAHTEVINEVLRLAHCENDEEQLEVAQEFGRSEIYQIQYHLAVLTTMHTDKRPGVLCRIKMKIFTRQNHLKQKMARSRTNFVWSQTVNMQSSKQ